MQLSINRLMTRCSMCHLLLCVLTVGALAGAKDCACASEETVRLHGGDKFLSMTVLLKGFHVGSRGAVASMGQSLRYEARVQNISPDIMRIPSPDKCFDIAITKASPDWFTRAAGGRVRNVATLMPSGVLEFSGQLTLLHTNVCHVRVSFGNNRKQQTKPVMVPHGRAMDGVATMVTGTEKVPIKNVWTGRISLSTALRTDGRLDDDLRTQYRIAIRKVLAFEQSAQSITNFNPAAHGRLALDHSNVTQQSEVLDLIRQMGRDANTKAVAWLWECFDKTGKNSPAHLAAMIELYYLLIQGIGCENPDKFFDVAKAHSTKQAITTRLYAMDAAGSYCVRDRFVCTAKGNRFSTLVTSEIQESARETLRALTSDPLKDIRTRAKRLLGVSTPEKPRGRRKYIKPADKKAWQPE